MVTLAPVDGLPIDRLAESPPWTTTPFYGVPDGTVGGPKFVVLTAPAKTLADGAGAYGTFRPGFVGTIRAVLARVKEDGTGANADITLQPRIGGNNLTGGALQILLATAVSGRVLLGTVVTALNTFDANDEIDINETEGSAFTLGEAEIMLLCEVRG